MTKNLLPMRQVMASISGQFKNLAQYRQYVIANNLTSQGFPLNPRNAYPYYPGVDQFLGNRPGTYYLWQVEDCKRRQLWKIGQAKFIEMRSSQKNDNLSIVDIYKHLLELNVSPQTLNSFLNDVKPSLDEMKELISALIEHSSRDKVKV